MQVGHKNFRGYNFFHKKLEGIWIVAYFSYWIDLDKSLVTDKDLHAGVASGTASFPVTKKVSV